MKNSSIKKQISKYIFFAAALITVINCLLSLVCVYIVDSRFVRATSDSAADFARLTINSDSAKGYLTTRKTDENYAATLSKLREFVSSGDSIIRISVVSYSNSTGYYIYDTGSCELGTKLPYDDYAVSVKAELINGRNRWQYRNGDKMFTYCPLRTSDDKQAGYVIAEESTAGSRVYYLVLSAVMLCMLGVCVILCRVTSKYLNKEVFAPIQYLSQTALDFTASDSESDGISRIEMFEMDKDNEIGGLGNAIKKMIYDINNSSRSLSVAVFDATHDSMTQLFNKRHYNNSVQSFKKCSSICAFYFDVNNLKLMNDTLGHSHGDHVIKKAAEYIKSVAGENGMAFRLGGDEFLLIMTNCSFRDINDIVEKADRDSPIILSREADSVKCALAYGYAYAKDNYSYEKILAEAEENMYKRKNELKNILNMPER